MLRAWMIAAAVLLAGGCVLAGEGGTGETYPAVYLKPVRNVWLERVLDGWMLDSLYPVGKDGRRGGWQDWDFTEGPRKWFRLPDHPLFEQNLPGARLYLVLNYGFEELESWEDGLPGYWVEFIGVLNNRFYDLPVDINQLLYDAGAELDLDHAAYWGMTVAAVLEVSKERLPGSRSSYVRSALDRRTEMLTGRRPVLGEMRLRGVRIDTAWGRTMGSPADSFPVEHVILDFWHDGASSEIDFGMRYRGTPRGIIAVPRFFETSGGIGSGGGGLGMPRTDKEGGLLPELTIEVEQGVLYEETRTISGHEYTWNRGTLPAFPAPSS